MLATVKRDQLKAQRDWPAADEEAFKAADPRNSTNARVIPTTRPRGCGTMASSIPKDTRRVLALGLAAARHAPEEQTRFGVFRM